MTTDYETKTKNNMAQFAMFSEAVNQYNDYMKSIGVATQQREHTIMEAVKTTLFMDSLRSNR